MGHSVGSLGWMDWSGYGPDGDVAALAETGAALGFRVAARGCSEHC